MRYYLISVVIHGLAFGVVFSVGYLGGFTPPQFSIAHGDGAAGGGGAAPVFDGEFLPPSHAVHVRLLPAVSNKDIELRQAEIAVPDRQFTPAVEAKHLVREVHAADLDPPPVPPPPAAPKAATKVADAETMPQPPAPHREASEVDIGEMMTTSTGPESAESSSANTGQPLPSGGGHGGEPGGQPTPFPANVIPPYPSDALARGVEGKVTLRVLVGEDGGVRSARVEISSGNASLDQSALNTVRDQWHFEPARRGGMPVAMEVRVPINFHLLR